MTGSRAVETQPERTALAWQRTGLGVLAVGGLVSHGALKATSPLLLVAAGITALLGLAILGGLAPVRYRRLQRAAEGRGGVAVPGLLRAATAIVVLTGVAALVTVVSVGRLHA